MQSKKISAPQAPKGNGIRSDHLCYGNALRLIATLVVITIHIGMFAYEASGATAALWIGHLCSAAGRWAVPAFFMLSGALLLNPTKYESDSDFYRKRSRRILVPLLLWTVVYLIFPDPARARPVSIYDWIMAIGRGVISGRPAPHMWFVYAIAFIYIATPAIRRWRNSTSWVDQWRVALFIVFISAVSTLLWTIAGDVGWAIPPQPHIFVEWIPFVGYFLLGALLRNHVLSRTQLAIGIIMCLVITGVCTAGTYFGGAYHQVQRAYGLFANPHSFIIIPFSITAYLCIATIFQEPPRLLRWLNSTMLANATFGVYLAHMLVIFLLSIAPFTVRILKSHPVAGTPLLWVAVTTISFGTVLGLQRIPYVRTAVGG